MSPPEPEKPQTIPKLKLRVPLPPKNKEPSLHKPRESESPRITPPPPLDPQELKKRTAAALAALGLLGPLKPKAVRADKASSTPGADSSLDEGITAPHKCKHSASESDVPEHNNFTSGEEEIDELDDNNNNQGSQEEEGVTSGSEEVDELDDVVSVQTYSFSVLVDGANTTVNISTNHSFKQLMSELADVLGIAPKNFKVAYCLSVDPRNSPWSHLKNSNDFTELFKKAFESTQKKRRSTHPFFVKLKDLLTQDNKSKGNTQSKKDKGKLSGRKKSRHESDSADSDTKLDPVHISKKKKSTTQWIAQLQNDNACAEHPGNACIKFASHHYQLSKNKLGAWAIFLTHNYTSTTKPPPQLKLGDRKPASKKNQLGQSPTAAPSIDHHSPGPHALPTTPTGPTHISPSIYPNYGYNPYLFHPPVMPAFIPPGYASSSSHHQYHGSLYHDNILSSDPAQEVEDVTLFPCISTWLSQLDIGPRGVDGHNFIQFTPIFERLKYIRICDIADNKTAEILLARCENMAEGTARKIISYAKNDTHNIQQREDKQQRRQHGKNQRYQ